MSQTHPSGPKSQGLQAGAPHADVRRSQGKISFGLAETLNLFEIHLSWSTLALPHHTCVFSKGTDDGAVVNESCFAMTIGIIGALWLRFG